MKKEDIEFLKELQHEMLTQDNVGQANPRFWVVRAEVRKYGVDEQISDGIVLCDEISNTIAENMEEAVGLLFDFQNDRYNFEYIKSDDCINYIDNENCKKGMLCDFDDIISLVNSWRYSISYYKNVDKIYENTMFLTLRECKEHIEANYYHYPKDAHSYAMTAWRSPQVERLYKILQNTDWDNIK